VKAATADIRQLVAFQVGENFYALDIMRIKEILNPVPITPVPKAPGFIEGVIELRGAILPVVDLRKRFDLPATPLGRSGKLVITAIEISGRRVVVALVVDGVLEPLRVAAEHFRAAPSLTQTGETAYFSAVVHYRRGRGGAAARDAAGEGARELRLERRRARTRSAAVSSEPTRRSDDLILMVLDIDALLSTSEKVSLTQLGAT
jgi:purine-binding chemotaxis protein CheW